MSEVLTLDLSHIPFDYEYIKLPCPHCKESKKFKDQLTALAWVTNHIQSKHPELIHGYATDE